MLDRAAHWDHVFERRDETALSWYEPAPEVALEQIARMGLGVDAQIVDIGTGLSRLPDRLLALGYRNITLVDVSAAAIERGSRRRAAEGLEPEGGLDAFVGDVTAWQPQRAFDLWHDRAVLHFLVDDEEQAAYRQLLEMAVAPDGHALIATFAPDGPETCSGLPVRRYGPSELAALAGPAFDLVDSRTFDHVTPKGSAQRFHLGWLRRRQWTR